MIDELKKGIKLLKYSFNFKTNLVAGIFFLICGVVFVFIDEQVFMLGGTYIMLAPIMMLQILFTMLCANIVASSPGKPVLEIWLASVIGGGTMILCYIFLIAITAFKISKTPLLESEYLKDLVCLGMVAAVLMMYMSVCYKVFVISVLGFCFVYPFIYSFIRGMLSVIEGHLTIVNCSLTGFGFVLLGAVLAFLINRILYRKPVSKWAMVAKFRKYM